MAGVLKLRKHFRMWQTSFEHGVNSLPFVCFRGYGNVSTLSITIRPRVVLQCCVWINSRIRFSKQGLTTVYPKKYAHGFCFAVLCCGYTLTDFPISTRLTSLALWQSNDCPSASKATLMNMDKYFMWIHYERLHNHNKAKHNKTVCIFLGLYCNRIQPYTVKHVAPLLKQTM